MREEGSSVPHYERLSPERKLAIGVVNQAVYDFGVRVIRRSKAPTETHFAAIKADTLAGKLSALYQRIDAGAFLLERTDECAEFWRTGAGIHRDAIRRRPGWLERLAGMRQAAARLAKKIRQEENQKARPSLRDELRAARKAARKRLTTNVEIAYKTTADGVTEVSAGHTDTALLRGTATDSILPVATPDEQTQIGTTAERSAPGAVG